MNPVRLLVAVALLLPLRALAEDSPLANFAAAGRLETAEAPCLWDLLSEAVSCRSAANRPSVVPA
ncbi:MAG: hypothetical protein HY303_21330 [Candidatus Wallbacteria bacterium]|nr:hypothetical protein [Candidatus Wallbacteria bacterium]